ncbi:hypothetical protein [Paraflavitalea speifideaquila]|uniref:hypothetical protein n=1 Tax=Paraflavitalea speifideaquila TaxID=3076558 RepID=UPI0028EAC700|nr:hypothetical protein [Paraflavitalea speifideiaquila]
MGTQASGVNMANIFNRPAVHTRIFSDGKGNLYDNYITRIVDAGKGCFWLGANNGLIRWNKETNQSFFTTIMYKPPMVYVLRK